ncbi:MAG: metalloregulator ArsR/SmtB family transcription factor [Polyangiaceae bacterium]|nr:metalloregulator ArsR/SmtB family transcription factor [Polyangiaceae bacterium]
MNLTHYAETLSLLGDESRLRLCALLHERELCVTDLVRLTGIAQSRVSTHLGRLRDAGLVRDRRDGLHAFYGLSMESMAPSAKALLTEALQSDDPVLNADRVRLRELDAERKGLLPESFAGQMERHYSPGRTWQSLATGLAGLLDLGDVLDVGSGDGAAASLFAARCKSLTCIDTSARMIEAAKHRFRKDPHVHALVADASDLPFRPATFDVAILFHTLTYAEQPAQVFDETFRVLRSGGRVVVLSLDEHPHEEITAPYGEVRAGFSPRALRGMLTRAGFSVSECLVACRESKKPHFSVVLAVAEKPQKQGSKSSSGAVANKVSKSTKGRSDRVHST